jgi:hypothetical protein
MNRREIEIDNKVTPVTPAGLCLSSVPTTGKYKQKYDTTCVFTGVGTVLRRIATVINYDNWDDGYVGLGKVLYINCFIECDMGVGWAGEGALRKVDLYE